MNDNIFCDNIDQIDLNTLQQLQGWQARYKQIVVWGKLLTAKPELRCDDYRVRGCETAAWLTHRKTLGAHEFALDADSKIIRGLAALLLKKIQHKTSADLKQLNIDALLIELDLTSHLSPSRSNGFLALAKRALSLALDQH